MSELKPCPFCGEKAKSWHTQDDFWCAGRAGCVNDDCYIKPCARGTDEEAAIRIWNTRYERTCRMTRKSDDCDEIYPVYWYGCSECGKTCEGAEDEPWYPICPNCGAKVVSA